MKLRFQLPDEHLETYFSIILFLTLLKCYESLPIVETRSVDVTNTSIPCPLGVDSNTTCFSKVSTTTLTTVSIHEKHDFQTEEEKLRTKASVIVGLVFLPSLIGIFVFCRYVPDYFIKLMD